MGMRAEESAARARKIPWRRNDRMSVAGREVFDWLPVFDLSTDEVFRVIRNAGQSPHWAYDRAERGADDPVVLGRALGRMHGELVHRCAHPVGRGQLRDHGHGGGHG